MISEMLKQFLSLEFFCPHFYGLQSIKKIFLKIYIFGKRFLSGKKLLGGWDGLKAQTSNNVCMLKKHLRILNFDKTETS